MTGRAEVIVVTGELDFDTRNPILVEEDGTRWRLVGAGKLLISDTVTVAGTRQEGNTLLVKAVLEEQGRPRLPSRSH